jgi:putative tryptophan/tyrosine transport system substrate-binding protein
MNSPNDSRLALLHACSKKLNLKINAVQIINGDLPAAIDKLLQNSDVLLALPDYKIYNRHSVKNILLSAYRLRIPVVGFSDSFVNAGAVAATYSSPDQIARQLTSIILDRMKNGALPDTGTVYPEYFSVSTNRQVANALYISLPSENSIKLSIQRMEAKQ